MEIWAEDACYDFCELSKGVKKDIDVLASWTKDCGLNDDRVF